MIGVNVLGEIRRIIRRFDLLPRGETIVVGVSGGPDSLCLLHALSVLREEFEVGLHVAHLHHGLRGADADADAEFVSELTAQGELPCTIGRRDVAAVAREHRLSIEEAARHARYAFLAETAQGIGSHIIAVAHNADDQAESVLMHFLRGSGTAGLRGMLHKSNISDFRLQVAGPQSPIPNPQLLLIRPLLSIPRADVERHCREHDLRPRFDASNLDTTFFRNRLRHELLPLLETYNPNIREVLRRTADVVAAEAEILRGETQQAWRETAISDSNIAVTFRLGAWRNLPPAMQRATLREAIRRLRPSLRNINFVHVDDAVSQVNAARTGARASLPQRLMLSVGYDTFTIANAGYVPDLPDWPLLEVGTQIVRVTLPGITPLPGSEWSLETVALDKWSDEVFANPDPWTAYLDGEAAGFTLSIRTRAPGDEFHPQGMPSPLRLTNWMTNVKIPRRVRDRLPLVVAGERIAWVTGHRIGQPFTIKASTRRILRLSFVR